MAAFHGIAIAGRATTGKTTTAALLIDSGDLPAWWVRAGLADEVKRDLASLGVYKDMPGGLGRSVLIAYGEAMRAAHGADYWLERMRRYHGSLRGMVVDDVRMEHERHAFERAGYMLVRLQRHPHERADALGISRRDPFLTDGGPTEAGVDALPPDAFHLTINATGTPPKAVAADILRAYHASVH